MNVSRETAAQNDSTKIIFKPLHDLKFCYTPKSQESSVEGQVSNELPIIKKKSTRKSDFPTKISQYTNTVNDTLKMKLKLSQLYDEISIIELKIHEGTVQFQNASKEHDEFTKSFENFLDQQYQKVKNSLKNLEKCENETATLKYNLEQLRNQLTSKSLRIYALEATWRTYKTSQNFVLHFSHLLGNKNYVDDFQNLQLQDKTLSLDELIENFKKLNNNHESFESEKFQNLTAASITEFLSKLKRQNLKLLRYNLHYQKLKNMLLETNNFFEENFKNSEESLKNKVHDVQKKNIEIDENLKIIEKQYKVLNDKVLSIKESTSLHDFIERLYERCFKTSSIEKSHLQMIKSVENYCHLLLCTLNSFDPDIIKKATHLSKT